MLVDVDKTLREVNLTLESGINRVKQLPEVSVRSVARKTLAPIFQTGFHATEYEHLDESLDQLENLFDENSLLVIAASHTSHSDILPGIHLVRVVRSRFPQIGNFYFPVAASLVRGVQGLLPQLLYSEGASPLLESPNLKPLSAVTDNDKINRGLKPTSVEVRRIIRAAKEPNSAILDLAEGSVEAGRHDVLGHMRGMQHVTNQFLPLIFQKASEAGKKVIVLPVATSGTNKMLSADSLLLTWRGIGVLIEDWVLKKPSKIARVVVGNPYVIGQNELDDPQALNDKVMQSIADLKPETEKGYYNSKTREYQEAMMEYDKNHSKGYRRLLQNLLFFHLTPIPTELKPLEAKYTEIKNSREANII